FAPIVQPLKERFVGEIRQELLIVFGTVGLVLLIACANVANLFLVRVEGRDRELALRSALGAGRRHLAGHLLGESLILALAGGALGTAIADLGVRGLVA
ncbi:MAG: multidrug ABC transporter substrate-binding protein, partial [Gammaproteobacteria bacterium]|nr:multidrug ABC transporter substrate-binding protein [Gammaproteobacteria bacterium]